MAILVINKELAGEEDLLLGEGTVTQNRNGTDQTLTLNNVAKWVPSVALLTALETSRFTRARLGITDDKYYWDPANVDVPDGSSVVPGDVTPGNWLLVPSGGGTSAPLAPNIQTAPGDAAYTLQLSDVDRLVSMQNAASFQSVTVPVDTTTSFPLGSRILVEQGLAGQTGLVPESGVTLEVFEANTGFAGPQAVVQLVHKTLNTWLVIPTPSLVTFINCAATGTWTEDTVIVPPVTASGGFDVAISLDGNYVVIGAPEDNPSGLIIEGSAHVYFYDGVTWGLQQSIVHNGHTPGDGIVGSVGTSVGISGNTIAIGNPETNTVEIWVRSGVVWAFQQALTGSNTAAGDTFGASLDLEGDYIVVGAPEHAPAGPDAGAGYVFFRSSGVWVEQLAATVAGAPFFLANFGRGVAISGDKVAFGEPETGNGIVSVYSRAGAVWSLDQEIIGAGVGNSQLGDTLSMSGDYLVTGQGPQLKSSVFFFDGAAWVEQISVGGSSLNTAVALHPLLPQLYVGFIFNNEVVVFDRALETWSFSAALAPVIPGNSFGASVAVSGCDVLAIGGPDLGTLDTVGQVYIYRSS